MRFVSVTLLLSIILWGYLVVSGIAGHQLIAGQNVNDFPSDAQRNYYVIIPLSVFVFCVFIFIFVRGVRWSSVRLASAVFSLLLLFPYIIFYRGGV